MVGLEVGLQSAHFFYGGTRSAQLSRGGTRVHKLGGAWKGPWPMVGLEVGLESAQLCPGGARAHNCVLEGHPS